jgi:hypothetical protein
MNPISAFFVRNIVAVFFLYGLANRITNSYSG